jgi:hypothetical protein
MSGKTKKICIPVEYQGKYLKIHITLEYQEKHKGIPVHDFRISEKT